eukprot:1157082-Pelagomonas_calceolata.AAC.2
MSSFSACCAPLNLNFEVGRHAAFEPLNKDMHWLKELFLGRESPSPDGKREASVGLVGSWQHTAQGHHSNNESYVLVKDGKKNYTGSENTLHIK